MDLEKYKVTSTLNLKMFYTKEGIEGLKKVRKMKDTMYVGLTSSLLIFLHGMNLCER
tara:strand:- start:209 stop:379 length:171 start_codon:yes stop_codon:yes gene_type:complete